jgi:REase_DpnII-MboI
MDEKDQIRRILKNVTALLEAMRFSSASASGEMANVGRYSSFKIFLRKYSVLAKQAAPLLPDATVLDQFALENLQDSGHYTWPVQKEMFDSAYSNASLLKSLLEAAIGYAEDKTHSLRDFISANLRRVIFAPPTKEIEIQNGIETLFVGRGMAKGTDYDRETGRVKVSGKEFVPDFILPQLNLCLEVKLCTNSTKFKEIVDEINADIRAYGTKYERQLYAVYDLGVIRDEAEFRRGLEDAPGVSVLIVKH